jgi:arylsulfatase A-like enzyme
MAGNMRIFSERFFTALWLSVTAWLQAQSPRPNILVIITDDQRFDTIKEAMPRTQARIFDEGLAFANAYATTPLCSPSRSSIMTGMYASHHGVRNNDYVLLATTFVERLQQAGYYTGLVGKYLNSENANPKPGYDYWIGLPSEGEYINPRLNINGVWRDEQGYLTYLLRDYAIDFLKKAATRSSQPFFLFFNPKTPHLPLQPAPSDVDLYPNLAPYRPPNYNETDVSDKPAWLRSKPRLGKLWQDSIDTIRRRQLQMLWSLDQSLDAILDELKNQDQLDQTAIVYISDHGYFWGEHRLTGKVRVYEPVSRVALALRYPAFMPAGKIEQRLVANIDIAPTIYELAGLPIPPEVDGRSLLALFQPQPWRTELLIEAWPPNQSYSAVHTDRYVYVETENDRAELYDLLNDPHQLQNSADDPNNAALVGDLKARLQKLLTAVGDKTPKEALPSSFLLFQNYPNPLHDATIIRFAIQRTEPVALQVFDLNGRLVATLINGQMNAGEHALRFAASSLPNGMYFYRLRVGAMTQQKKLVVLR